MGGEFIVRRRLMLLNEVDGGGGGLPSEYQQVEWIGQTGKANLDTGVVPSNGKLRFKLKYLIQNRGQYGVYTITNNASNSTNSAGIAVFMTTAYRVRVFSKTVDIYLSPENVNCSNKTIELDFEIDRGNDQNVPFSVKLLVNNTEYTENGLVNVESFSTGALHLFGWKGGATYMTGMIYSCDIWDSSEKVRSFIPCYRKSDGTIGMYDTVSNTFFTNAGSGTFTKGADV